MVGLLDLRARGQSDVTSEERRGIFGDLRLSRFLQSGEEENQCGWCMVSIFPNLSLYISISQSWSSSLRISFAFFSSGSAVEKFVFYSVFVFRSDHIEFPLFFYRESHGLVEKLLLVIFIFLTKFIDISLCADPMRRNPFFHFEESFRTDNIRENLLWTIVGIIIFCVR